MKTNCLILLVLLSLPEYSLTAQNTPYGHTTPAEVKNVMERVLNYAEQSTPVGIINRSTGADITDLKKPLIEAGLAKGEYNITSHEWGLAYSGMILAGQTTGDHRFTDYVAKRFEFLGKASPYFRAYKKSFPSEANPLEHFLYPQSLDDTGSMCAALIQGWRIGVASDLKSEIDNSISYIMTKQYRLTDGTFARNRPMKNSVWVDDLYQGIPALAQMGKLTGERKYYDEAAKQVILFAGLLFDKNTRVCTHGSVEGIEPQPAFFWARANGWAIMAIASVLDVLPEDHPQRNTILELFRSYTHGLLVLQSSSGFWHQLLDRNDSFLETSSTAMFTYVFAHGINQGWLDVRAYGPPAVLGWNAVSTKVNDKGQVEGTCAGTGIAFDAAFYYQRPVGTGPHGYGSVMMAGAAMYKLLKDHPFDENPVTFRK